MHSCIQRALTGCVMALAITCFSVGPAGAAAGPGAAKLPLVGPTAEVFCSDVQPVPWEDAGTAFPGFVVFNEDVDADLVKATVSVKGWEANTTYPVRLIQAGSGDCHTVDGAIETNGQGNGTLHLEEAKSPGAPAMQIIVDTGTIFGTPSVRATEPYELA